MSERVSATPVSLRMTQGLRTTPGLVQYTVQHNSQRLIRPTSLLDWKHEPGGRPGTPRCSDSVLTLMSRVGLQRRTRLM